MPAASDMPYKQARKWRLITIPAGFLLASAFFMPAVEGCNEPVVPVVHLYDVIIDVPNSSQDILGDIFEYFVFICM